VALDLTQLRELLEALNQTDFAEVVLKSNEFELTVRRGIPAADALIMATPTAAAPALPIAHPVASPCLPPTGETAAPAGATPPTALAPPPSSDRRLVDITSPMVGTFYHAPAPDEPPFVELGDRIRKGQAVCIIEAMKLMNELEAEVTGEIVEILVENGQPVEYGQPLMRVNPD